MVAAPANHRPAPLATTTATARSGGLTVTLTATPTQGKTGSPVALNLTAYAPHAPGALDYRLRFGDGTSAEQSATTLSRSRTPEPTTPAVNRVPPAEDSNPTKTTLPPQTAAGKLINRGSPHALWRSKIEVTYFFPLRFFAFGATHLPLLSFFGFLHFTAVFTFTTAGGGVAASGVMLP